MHHARLVLYCSTSDGWKVELLQTKVTQTTNGPAKAATTQQRSLRSTGGKFEKRRKSNIKKVSLHVRIWQLYK